MYLRNTLGLKPQTEKKNNNNLKEDIKYNKISDWKSNDKNQALEVGKPKKKRSIRRAIGRATRNYGSGVTETEQPDGSDQPENPDRPSIQPCDAMPGVGDMG